MFMTSLQPSLQPSFQTRPQTRRNPRFLAAITFAAALLTAAPAALAQTPAVAATLHGHVTSAAGTDFPGGDLKLTKEKNTDPKTARMLYDFKIDASGNYTGAGIESGDYSAFVTQGDKFIDRLEVQLLAGDNKTLDFDMTREAYQKALSPEEKKALEEYKKQNEATTATNKVINNLNATLMGVRADLKTPAPNFEKDVADMKAATDGKPEEGILWMTYGEALSASAANQAKTDRAAGKPAMSDDQVLAQYQSATEAFKKGIDLNAASKKPSPADQAIAWNSMGNAFANEGKINDAQAAFDTAAKLDPAHAGMYYNNQAAIFYNASQTNSSLSDAALAAADKAIAADPDRADAYYVRAQILLQKATVDKAGKIILPDGCEDAYQHYLALAPDGKFAPSVKEVLAGLNIKINTKYSAGKKK
jgi:tetratricopeptide (TPR) repeat protein